MGKPAIDLTREEQRVRYHLHRKHYLPEALDGARRKVEALENEARRYGMVHLLEDA